MASVERATADKDDAAILVAYASQTGHAAELARQTAEQLQLPAALPLNQVDARHLSQARRALFVVSTYGEGDPPDMAARFNHLYLRGAGNDLSHLSYAVLALGDRQYPRFCGFGHKLSRGLRARGARPIFSVIEMDGQDSTVLLDWYGKLTQVIDGPKPQVDTEPVYLDTTLRERIHLNPGSPGAPVYLLSLKTHQSLLWQAGDIASVLPELPPGQQDERLPKERDYSIASMPEEGELKLVVRQRFLPDGRLGLASSWLTERAPLHGQVRLRLRGNPGFHSPPFEAPMILIGNGTGIAGLRAHLKAREGRSGDNWLLFGERSPHHDTLFADDLRHWQQQGHLTRVDLTFSRASDPPRYVQNALANNAHQLKRWVARGAYIFLCGSRTGMAADVDRVLKDILGDAGVRHLLDQGRLRRDIY